MKYVFPNMVYEQKAVEFIREFYDHSSDINGTGGLDDCLKSGTYADWLVKVIRDLDIANMPEGRVPAYTYFYVREEDDAIIGMINIRLALNDFLRREGGHIGYCVRPKERSKGYCTAMVRGALDFLRQVGLNEIIITCDKDNPASAAVIKKCGGALECEFYSETFETIVQRYIIRNDLEKLMDEADNEADASDIRYKHGEIFKELKDGAYGKQNN